MGKKNDHPPIWGLRSPYAVYSMVNKTFGRKRASGREQIREAAKVFLAMCFQHAILLKEGRSANAGRPAFDGMERPHGLDVCPRLAGHGSCEEIGK